MTGSDRASSPPPEHFRCRHLGADPMAGSVGAGLVRGIRLPRTCNSPQLLAGLLAAQKASGKALAEEKVVFLGAGEAVLGIANLIVMAMMESSISE